MGLSYLYVTLLNTQSNYLTGLFPAFLARGLAIPVFSACVSLAVMSALPYSKAGLAAGTLSMARNVGTALGIALQGGIFGFYISHTLPQRLDALPAAESASLTRAAGQFVALGQGASQQVVRSTILDGFILVAWVCGVLCGLATVVAVLIRKK